MRPLGVVVARCTRPARGGGCRCPKISMRSVSSVRTVNTRRSAKQFARGHRGVILTTSMPASASTASNEAANCPARSRTRNRNRRGAASQQQDQLQHMEKDQVQQPQRHGGDHARPPAKADHRWSAACATFWNPTAQTSISEPTKINRPRRRSPYDRYVRSRLAGRVVLPASSCRLSHHSWNVA